MVILSVGCGERPSENNVVRLDLSSEVNPDIVWNLNTIPYPFEDNSFSEIECFDVIESSYYNWLRKLTSNKSLFQNFT